MIIPVKDKAGLGEFIGVAESIYQGDPHWVKPLAGVRPEEFMKRTNPAIQYHDMELFVWRQNDRPLGRIAAFVDWRYNTLHHEETAFFGFFECIDHDLVARNLFTTVEGFAKAKGMKKVMGPVDFSTNYQSGLLIDGYSRPTVMTPYNKEYYPRLVESQGFTKLIDLFTYRYYPTTPIPEHLNRMSKIQQKRHPEISVQSFDKIRGVNTAAVLTKLYAEAFSRNWGYVPMAASEFSHLLKTLDILGCADLNYLAFSKGKPVGFLLTVPDLYSPVKHVDNQPPYYNKLRVTTLGVNPSHRNKGIEAILGTRMLSDIFLKGYEEIEFSVILENNGPMNNYISREFNLPVNKTFRVYQKPL